METGAERATCIQHLIEAKKRSTEFGQACTRCGEIIYSVCFSGFPPGKIYQKGLTTSVDPIDMAYQLCEPKEQEKRNGKD